MNIKLINNLFNFKSFESVLYEWLNNRKQNIKESSYNKYLYQIQKNIIPYFKNVSVKKIDKEKILDYFSNDNIVCLSNSTKNNILIIINSTINYCVSKKYIKKIDDINIKFKKDINEITYFSKKEQELIIDYINDNMNLRNLLILFTLFTGLRIGEVCSLKGTDIDFVNNTVSVQRTVQRIRDFDNEKNKTKLQISLPKTKSSIRVIPVPEFIIKILMKYINDKSNYIFTDSNMPKDPRSVEKYFSNLLNKLDIRNLNFHSLRHSYATRLMEENVDIKVISELLGHSNWKITLTTYVHVSIDCKKESVNKLNNLWNNKKFVEVV